MDQVVAAMRSYLVGWKGYFQLADTPGIFADLDGWIRRRLVALQLKQWRRGTTAYRKLRARGVSEARAAMAAAHVKRWWRTAAHGAINVAFPADYFAKLGVPKLAA